MVVEIIKDKHIFIIEKRKEKACYELFLQDNSVCHFVYHIAGTAAKPHAVNPRKIARVTSPSPRLSGKKRLS